MTDLRVLGIVGRDRTVEERAQEAYRVQATEPEILPWPGGVVAPVARLAVLGALLPAEGVPEPFCRAISPDRADYLAWVRRVVRDGPDDRDLDVLAAVVAVDGRRPRVLDPFAGRGSLLGPVAEVVDVVAVERDAVGALLTTLALRCDRVDLARSVELAGRRWADGVGAGSADAAALRALLDVVTSLAPAALAALAAAYVRALEAARQAARPVDRDGAAAAVGTVVAALRRWAGSGGGAVMASAAAVPVRSGTIDCVVTDPPYYDLVAYEAHGRRLADGLGVVLEGCASPLSELLRTSTEDVPATFDARAFECLLEHAFREVRRVLAAHGRAVVLNTPKRLDFLAPLARADLVVTDALLLNVKEPYDRVTETGRWWGSRTVLLECAARAVARRARIADERPRMGWDRVVGARIAGIPGAVALGADAILPHLRAATERAVDRAVPPGDTGDRQDAAARFVAAWSALFGVLETDASEAAELARAVGADLDGLVSARVIDVSGGVARLVARAGAAASEGADGTAPCSLDRLAPREPQEVV